MATLKNIEIIYYEELYEFKLIFDKKTKFIVIGKENSPFDIAKVLRTAALALEDDKELKR